MNVNLVPFQLLTYVILLNVFYDFTENLQSHCQRLSLTTLYLRSFILVLVLHHDSLMLTGLWMNKG